MSITSIWRWSTGIIRPSIETNDKLAAEKSSSFTYYSTGKEFTW